MMVSFLATLTLVDKFFHEEPTAVTHLKKARKEGIELEKVDLETLRKRMEELGSSEVMGSQRKYSYNVASQYMVYSLG